MAKTIEQWQQLIIDQLAANNIQVSGSRTSIRRLWTYVFAYCTWALEQLFDLHKQDVTDQIANMKPHSLRWYRTKSMLFQFGYPLIEDTDQYDNTLLTPEQIEASKIIKYCAVNEAANESRLIIKIATEDNNGVLAPIEENELVSFKQYLADVKDAGNTITVTNYLPDILDLETIIYYDPLLIAADGTNILDGLKPVDIAINKHLKELPFNGVLILASLVDSLQNVPGVEIPHIVKASSSWINPTTGGYGAPQVIGVYKIPESGYFKVTDFSKITYVPYG